MIIKRGGDIYEGSANLYIHRQWFLVKPYGGECVQYNLRPDLSSLLMKYPADYFSVQSVTLTVKGDEAWEDFHEFYSVYGMNEFDPMAYMDPQLHYLVYTNLGIHRHELDFEEAKQHVQDYVDPNSEEVRYSAGCFSLRFGFHEAMHENFPDYTATCMITMVVKLWSNDELASKAKRVKIE